jgi:hypothetical protein
VRIGIWNNYKVFSRNRLFDARAYGIGEDLGYPVRYLREKLESQGHSLDTLDMYRGRVFDKVIFFDYPDDPRFSPSRYACDGIPCYLILTETELINPSQYQKVKHTPFRKILTYVDTLVDGSRYVLCRLPHRLAADPVSFRKGFGERPGLVVMIACDKSSHDPRELYSERRRAIKWFEDNAPNDFDLYGKGWRHYRFTGPKLIRALNLLKPLTRLLGEKRPSYRGEVRSKYEVMSRYRFSICYENSRDIPGYISEKIFDSMAAGCVPVYRGAPNISALIDQDTYIDGDGFKDYGSLYEYLKSIGPKEFGKRQKAMASYMISAKARQFSAEGFVEVIEREIVND